MQEILKTEKAFLTSLKYWRQCTSDKCRNTGLDITVGMRSRLEIGSSRKRINDDIKSFWFVFNVELYSANRIATSPLFARGVDWSRPCVMKHGSYTQRMVYLPGRHHKIYTVHTLWQGVPCHAIINCAQPNAKWLASITKWNGRI